MAKAKLEFFNEDQIEVLKEMYENDWDTVHPSEILGNIVGHIPGMSASFLSDVSDEDEENIDTDLIAITYSEYTDQPLGMAQGIFEKVLGKFVAELKKVFKEVTGKTLTLTEYEEMNNWNRSYWKTAMKTEMFHYEMVYEYSISGEDKEKGDAGDKIDFKYDAKMNSKYSEKESEDSDE